MAIPTQKTHNVSADIPTPVCVQPNPIFGIWFAVIKKSLSSFIIDCTERWDVLGGTRR